VVSIGHHHHQKISQEYCVSVTMVDFDGESITEYASDTTENDSVDDHNDRDFSSVDGPAMQRKLWHQKLSNN